MLGFIKDIYTAKICDDCNDLAAELSKVGGNRYQGYDKWKSLFVRICRSFGMNKRSALVLWNEIGVDNNWVHLYMTDKEKSYAIDNWKCVFIGELMCCSDKWSFDRLLRTQWAYRHWLNKISETYWEELKTIR